MLNRPEVSVCIQPHFGTNPYIPCFFSLCSHLLPLELGFPSYPTNSETKKQQKTSSTRKTIQGGCRLIGLFGAGAMLGNAFLHQLQHAFEKNWQWCWKR
ncbi:hypothetical protein ACSBR1_039971 [Camellia fascicularis]